MRIIAITGATGGLAKEIVKQLPSDDFVIALGRNVEKLEVCYAERPNTVCYKLDMSSDEAIGAMVEKLYAKHGHIDVFINNAGYGDFSEFDAYTTAEIRDMFDINTFATMTFSRLVGHRMKKAGYGHIVNIASIAGLIASAKSSVYSATKFAVIGFSNALRLELADSNVYVTTINPGPIATSFFDKADPSGEYLKSVGRFVLQPEEVARRTVAILGKNKREVNMPWSIAAAHKFYTLFPKIADFLARKVFNYK